MTSPDIALSLPFQLLNRYQVLLDYVALDGPPSVTFEPRDNSSVPFDLSSICPSLSMKVEALSYGPRPRLKLYLSQDSQPPTQLSSPVIPTALPEQQQQLLAPESSQPSQQQQPTSASPFDVSPPTSSGPVNQGNAAFANPANLGIPQSPWSGSVGISPTYLQNWVNDQVSLAMHDPSIFQHTSLSDMDAMFGFKNSTISDFTGTGSGSSPSSSSLPSPPALEQKDPFTSEPSPSVAAAQSPLIDTHSSATNNTLPPPPPAFAAPQQMEVDDADDSNSNDSTYVGPGPIRNRPRHDSVDSHDLRVMIPGKKGKPCIHCSECEKTFSRKHDLLRHEVRMHGKVCELVCHNCAKFFSSALRFKKHQCNKLAMRPPMPGLLEARDEK